MPAYSEGNYGTDKTEGDALAIRFIRECLTLAAFGAIAYQILRRPPIRIMVVPIPVRRRHGRR